MATSEGSLARRRSVPRSSDGISGERAASHASCLVALPGQAEGELDLGNGPARLPGDHEQPEGIVGDGAHREETEHAEPDDPRHLQGLSLRACPPHVQITDGDAALTASTDDLLEVLDGGQRLSSQVHAVPAAPDSESVSDHPEQRSGNTQAQSAEHNPPHLDPSAVTKGHACPG